MVTSMSMAAILARVSRHRVILRRVRSTGVLPRDRSVVSGASRVLTWRETRVTSLQHLGSVSFSTDTSSGKKLPSLVITEAFEDHEEEEDDASEDDGELSFGVELDEETDVPTQSWEQDEDTPPTSVLQLTEEEQRALAERLRFAMDRKKQWMQRLAEEGAFDTLVKVVVECYAPLYTSHPSLQHEICSLAEAYEDPVAVEDAVTKYHPKWYDDQVTKITEQEAMALFVTKQRPELAMAIFHHREWLAQEIGSVTISQGHNVLSDDVTVDFANHFRSYYSWAMGAASLLGDHAKVFMMYESALEHDVFPTANMTLTYLNSLIAKHEYDAIEALFEQIQKDDRPTNLYFYRQMLFYARLTGNTKIMDIVLGEMNIKGFKLRSEDYLNAIRSMDDLYFHRSTDTAKGIEGGYFLDETYKQCLTRLDDQERSPDKYKPQEKASATTVKLFEEMIEGELMPHNELFFPRVISAAMFLHDYDRVTEYVALHERCFDKPLSDPMTIKTVVNALLLKDEPKVAWELVIYATHVAKKKKKTKKKNKSKSQERIKLDTPLLDAMGSVVEYLESNRDTALVLELLAAFDAEKLLVLAVTRDFATTLLNVLVRDRATVSNEQLWQLVSNQYWRVFAVQADVKLFYRFINFCMAADRWWVVSKVVHQRDRTKIPTIPTRLALRLSTKGLENPSDLERVDTIAHLISKVDMSTLNDDDRLLLCCNTIRALHLLRHDSSRGLHRQREINRIHDQYLRGKGKNIPLDVREILMQQS